MSCETIQDMILTDYMDGTLDDSKKKYIEHHLSFCPQCREFEAMAVKTVKAPFEGVKPITVDQAALWQDIKNNLVVEEQPTQGFWEGLRQWIPHYRPVYSFAIALFFMLATASIVLPIRYSQIAQKEQMQERAQYLSFVMNDLNATKGAESVNYGTRIEQYFL